MKERIRADKKSLKKQGFVDVELEASFNYFDDWENAVMIYSAKTNKSSKDITIKYSMPKHFQIDNLYIDRIVPNLKSKGKYEVLQKDQDYARTGAIYNLVIRRGKEKYAVAARVSPDYKVMVKEMPLKAVRQSG